MEEAKSPEEARKQEAAVVRGDAFTTAVDYAPAVKAKAYELFLHTNLDLVDIAIDLSIPAKVVAQWSRDGGWRKRKEELEMELFRSAEDKYRRFVIEKRQPTIERHLRVAEKLELAIEETLAERAKDGNVSERTLVALTKAFSEVTGVSARAAAITDTPFSDANGGKKQLTPVILIGGQVSAPVTAQVVDAEFEEKKETKS